MVELWNLYLWQLTLVTLTFWVRKRQLPIAPPNKVHTFVDSSSGIKRLKRSKFLPFAFRAKVLRLKTPDNFLQNLSWKINVCCYSDVFLPYIVSFLREKHWIGMKEFPKLCNNIWGWATFFTWLPVIKTQQMVEKITTELEQPLCSIQRLINSVGGSNFHTPISQ